MFDTLSPENKQRMQQYTADRIARMSASEIEGLPTLESGHMADYKIITRDRVVGVVRAGPDDGYFGEKIIHEKFVAGCWVSCDAHGRVRRSA